MILLLDTSTRTAVVALAEAGGQEVLGVRTYPAGEGGSSLLLGGGRELLQQAGTEIGSISGLVVNRGPGSYTGLRVGYALAQGLAESRHLPIAGIPSFLALADEHRVDRGNFVACFDAKSRGIAWVSFVQGDAGPQPWEDDVGQGAGLSDALDLGTERIGVKFAPAEAVPGLISRPCRVAGPGVVTLREQLQENVPDDLDLIAGSERPSPEALFRLGSELLQEGGQDPATLGPLYLGTIAPPAARTGR